MTNENAVQIHHPVTSELVTVFVSGEGQLRTVRFACGSTALLDAAFVRKAIKRAKTAQEGK